MAGSPARLKAALRCEPWRLEPGARRWRGLMAAGPGLPPCREVGTWNWKTANGDLAKATADGRARCAGLLGGGRCLRCACSVSQGVRACGCAAVRFATLPGGLGPAV
jgi:hypothetical protein